jgi:O-antigen/teichoic acid export membrane protein
LNTLQDTNSPTSKYQGVKEPIKKIAAFLLGQGSLQIVNALTGLFLVHTLSIEAYAQFGLAFGFQSVASALTNLGFTSTIIPLVGSRTEDRSLTGKYVRAAKRLRDLSFAIVSPVAAIIFLAMAHIHKWSLLVQLGLLASILISIFYNGSIACFSAPLIIYGRIKEYYTPQTTSSFARLFSSCLLYEAGLLSSWTAALLSALSTVISAHLLSKEGRKLMVWPSADESDAVREMLRTIMPAMPAIVFAAFQAQLALLLVAIFGKTSSMAQVAALSRIGQLFTVLATFNTVVIEPYTAKQARNGLLNKYLGIIVLAGIGCLPLVAVSFLFPNTLLWLLGAKYNSLRGVVGWYVASTCISYIAGLMWTMNRSRKWIFWSGAWLEVLLIVLAQTWFVITFGIDTAEKAVFFSLSTSLCYLIAHSYNCFLGFREQDAARPFALESEEA